MDDRSNAAAVVVNREAVARRAIACAGWSWRPGAAWFDECGVRWRVASTWHAEAIHADRLPDLDDPATVGILLALVREAWGDPYLCCVGDRETGWRLDGYAAVADIHSYRSEAEALVTALEAASFVHREAR